MSEERKKNAIELSDDEMEEVSGGYATVMIDRGRARYTYSCSRGMRKAKDFYNIIIGTGKCKKSDSCDTCAYCQHDVVWYGPTKPDAYEVFLHSANYVSGYDFFHVIES